MKNTSNGSVLYPIWVILIINLLVLLAYSLGLKIWFSEGRWDYEELMASALCIGAQVSINIVATLIFFGIGKTIYGKAFLLSAVVVLTIGFSVCYGFHLS